MTTVYASPTRSGVISDLMKRIAQNEDIHEALTNEILATPDPAVRITLETRAKQIRDQIDAWNDEIQRLQRAPPDADRGTETPREDTYLAPFLCDRNEQEVQLRRALASARTGWAGRPFVSIVHGSQDQCLDKFLERLTRVLLPSLLGRVQEETIDWPRSYRGPEHLHAWLTDRLAEKFLPPEPAARLAESGIAEVARAIAARRAPVAIQAFFSSEDWIVGGWAMLEAFLGYWSGWPDAPPGSPLLVIFGLKYRTRPAPRPLLARFLCDRYGVANREAREALLSLSFARWVQLRG